MSRSSYQRRSYQPAKPRSVVMPVSRNVVSHKSGRDKDKNKRRELGPEMATQQVPDVAPDLISAVDTEAKVENISKPQIKKSVKKSFSQTVKYKNDTTISDIIPAPRRIKSTNSAHRVIGQESVASAGLITELVPKSVKPNLSQAKQAKQTKQTKQTKKPKKSEKLQKTKVNHEKRQTIGAHVDEFRRRLLYCIVALVIGGVVGYRLQTEIIKWLVKPLGQQLFYTSPTGGFDFLIKICLFFGFLLAIPVIIYNFIRFLAPAVPERVSYSTVKLLFVSMILALMGVAFAYYVSLPAALHFLNNFTNDQIQSLISAQEYFSFVMLYLAGFAALFQMPLIFAFINKVTPLKPGILMQKQRIVILVSFIVAAVLTPTPDPMNQTLMAIPIIGLYQTSVGVVWQDNRRKRRKQSKNEQVNITETTELTALA